MLNKLIIYMFCMLIARLSLAADRSACDGLLKPMSEVLINSSVVLSTPPKSIFGFTVDWYLFQKGHFRKGKVRDETISYLKPFEGAIYRYSGGNDFPWENAVGPIAKRKRILTNYEGLKYPEFGPKEFIDFLDSVNGDATILIDLARKYNKSFTKDQILDSNLDYIDFYKKNASNCSEFSAGCRIKYFELGNEVDWEEGLKWSPIEYQSRIDGLIKKSKLITPKINFAITGQTAPWGEKPSGQYFDSYLADKMAFQIDAVTFHPYYDGLPINQMTKWGAEVVNKYKKINPKIKLLVTEHGRWPADSPTGDWKDNWYQASGSGGAISTADYVLSLINDRSVAGAMWHSIAVESPWQLFHLDRAKDSIYPSGVYFGLLVLRNGFLDTSVLIKPSKITTYAYSPQQDLNMAAMKNSAGLNSILGVNRGAARLVKFKDLTGNIVLRNPVIEYMSADSSYSDNTDENKSRVSITSSAIKAVGQEYVCIPSRSVFNIKYK